MFMRTVLLLMFKLLFIRNNKFTWYKNRHATQTRRREFRVGLRDTRNRYWHKYWGQRRNFYKFCLLKRVLRSLVINTFFPQFSFVCLRDNKFRLLLWGLFMRMLMIYNLALSSLRKWYLLCNFYYSLRDIFMYKSYIRHLSSEQNES